MEQLVKRNSRYNRHFLQHQDILYDYKVELTGVGNRSQINADDNIVTCGHWKRQETVPIYWKYLECTKDGQQLVSVACLH